MTDWRTTPDTKVARSAEPKRIVQPVVDLLAAPDGPRDRQLLYGDPVTVLGQREGQIYLRSDGDGYHGYVSPDAVGAPRPPTHHVVAPSTHAYADADMKSPDRAALSLGSSIRSTGERSGFVETELGYVPSQHLSPIETLDTDPVAVADRLLGTPYLWGGNSRWGIDCSGLIQIACRICGLPCPGDSDQQATTLGQPVAPGSRPKRGDLLFWKGHVAWVADDTRILHANAYAMAVTYEDRDAAIDRIAAAGDGPVTAHKRL